MHNGDEARRAADIARHTFDNFNLDLMYALPGQSVEQALADIETALNFAPTHLSCYHLTLEPNTLFYRHPPALPDDDTSADMQEAIEARLATAGFVHYETSAFSLPERQARHNLNYWTFGDYLGIGAGAHSKLSFPDKILRQVRYKQPAAYLNAITARAPIQTEHAVSQADLPFEFMLNALRLTQGFPSTLFAERTGLPLIKLASALRRAEQQDLVRCTLENIAPSPRGQRFLNELLQLFMPE